MILYTLQVLLKKIYFSCRAVSAESAGGRVYPRQTGHQGARRVDLSV